MPSCLTRHAGSHAPSSSRPPAPIHSTCIYRPMAVRVPTSQHGETALHWAAEHGAVDAIDELVRRGANVDAMSGTVSCNSTILNPTPTHSYRAHTPCAHRDSPRCTWRRRTNGSTRSSDWCTTVPASGRRTGSACPAWRVLPLLARRSHI